MNQRVSLFAAGAAFCFAWFCAPAGLAQNVSPPTILQWFETEWQTMEERSADLFMAGYGGVWTPAPGRGIYTTGGNGIGYDVYDRFDLGKPGDPTLFGTETGYKTAVQSMQRAGASVYADFLINHASSFDWTDVDGDGTAFTVDPASTIANHGGGNPGFYHGTPGSNPGSDFHSNPPPAAPGTLDFEYQFQLAQLWDIDHRVNNNWVRQPVDAGDPNNIPGAGNSQYLLPEWDPVTRTFSTNPTPRLANLPDEYNRRFYYDQTSSITVNDTIPGSGGVPESGPITLYNFTGNEATSGIPVEENANAYLMRHARWMIQEIGVDGFRVDAARHVYPFVHEYFDRAVFRADQRTNLDGSPRQVFSFLESFTGDRAYLQTFIRKDIDPNNLNQVGGNRDVLDLPLFFAMHDNLTANTGNNNWHNIRQASQDAYDNGFMDGSAAVKFVSSHDEEGAHLSNVAHAYMLMLPGNALVYHNARGFNANPTVDERPFPKDGRGDALGGFYGDTIITLANIRNTHGRGDYLERYIDDAFNPNGFSNIYVYEREGSAVVALNSRVGGFGDWDARSGITTSFAPGTILVELTGNSLDPTVDTNEGTVNEIPEVIVVGAGGTIDLRIPQNHPDGGANHGKGYVIYGLATPEGDLSLTNVSQTLGGGTPTAQNNPTNRLTDISVITADSFEVRLDTFAVTHSDGGNQYRDPDADGDYAVLKFNAGLDINGNGGVDHVTPDSVTYGFEDFLTQNEPGYFDASGDGTYRQVIDATALAEGQHFVTTRAFRHRSDGGPAVFSDFKRVIYIDRLPPEAVMHSFDPSGTLLDAVSTTAVVDLAPPTQRDVIVRSADLTADAMHIFVNEGAALSDQSFIDRALLGEGGSERIDRDLFSRTFTGVASGNHAFTVVTFEPTGNVNVQRFAGWAVTDGVGFGLGDTDFDGDLDPDDLTNTPNGFEAVLYSQDTAFNPAADVDGDGRVGWSDLVGLEAVLVSGGADAATRQAWRDVVTRRGDVNGDGFTNAADIDAIYAAAATNSAAWSTDLNSSGVATQEDVGLLVSVVLQTYFGDVNLDGGVDEFDLARIAANWQQGGTGWASGDVTGDGATDADDLIVLAGNWYAHDPGAATISAEAILASFGVDIPEPTSLLMLLLGLPLLARRGRVA